MSFKIADCPEFYLPLPDGHRFPMAKYELLPKKLIADGIATPEQFFTPRMATVDEILTTHTADYWHALDTLTLPPKECRKIGLPMSKALIDRERLVVGATIECAKFALTDGISLPTSGGTHHAFADSGEGFCILNDICVASNVLLKEGLAKRILILDLDVHQGNGNASLMANNANVFVMSMHGEKNYPYHKPKSDLDIGLADGVGDDEYLSLLKYHLPQVLDDFKPDFVFYQAGVDVLADDRLGRINLTMNGLYERERYVIETLFNSRLPTVVTMGGGYAPDIGVIVQGHSVVFGVVGEIFKSPV
ncbi:histone deacetylase [Moraxella bovis]|uniref:histone deacetylase family protein n=1 Tax=Moraxella bovis TaxID=476 RepID=UPI002226A0D4|nr:histone deacetylase [Moraxella bovis]UYZ71142.1 histone deacetylase [Moraxella bovis]UYZ72941.1 histone deacetylase [Moraxella bovis]UZA14437.1 histone deacetylase [Moraxella bovis]UZA42822.1 histone deacetylase [Moraxella bovis]WAJ73390.1 histone deacetylase [Moraxella bovis]